VRPAKSGPCAGGEADARRLALLLRGRAGYLNDRDSERNERARKTIDYMRMSCYAARVTMGTTVLATAIELARLHGVRFAASYLCEEGIALEVAVETLAHGQRDHSLPVDKTGVHHP
jgi:hypothetical protein